MKHLSHLVFASLALSSFAVAQNVDRVLLAKSPDASARAWFSPDVGLWLEGFAGRERLVIGHGSEARFDEAGTLYFTRSFDDGHEETRRVTMRLRRGDARAQVVPTRAAPAYRLPSESKPQGMTIKVCVDAGHGGSDPGALGNGLRESDVNLAVAKRLQAWLALDTADTRGGGTWNVLMTRTSDATLSLAGRTNAANAFSAASFLSIHMNGFGDPSANGSETFCYTGQSNGAGGRYRNRLQAELLAAWGLRNRGNKEANFYVLRNTRMPAALLEGGFITNSTDSSRMKDASRIDRLALGLLWATQEHHGLRRYTPQSGPRTGRLLGVVFDASKSSSARIANATVALANGVSMRSASTTGLFRFELTPGSYTYIASAPGFAPLQLSRTVAADQDIWGSTGLRPTVAPTLATPGAVSAGSALTMTIRADARSPVLLAFGGRARLQSLGSFGILVPDLASAIFVNAGVTSSTGALTARLQTTSAMRGVRALVQPFALRARAWKFGNTAGFAIN